MRVLKENLSIICQDFPYAKAFDPCQQQSMFIINYFLKNHFFFLLLKNILIILLEQKNKINYVHIMLPI